MMFLCCKTPLPLLLSLAVISLMIQETNAFIVGGVPASLAHQTQPRQHEMLMTRLRYRNHVHHDETEEFITTLPDIDKMKNSEMRNELESYGIPTKQMLEKNEFVQALEKARAEGKKPVIENTIHQSATKTNQGDGGGTKVEFANIDSNDTREVRYQKALEYAKGMNVKNLKQALQERGIKITSFFEKSEFEKAYADAVADNVPKKKASTTRKNCDEPYDPSYRDVICQKVDPRYLVGQSIIDI